MKLNNETILIYLNQVYKIKKQFSHIRLGQCYISVFKDMFSNIESDLYIGKEHDCSNDDNNIDNFIKFIYTLSKN